MAIRKHGDEDLAMEVPSSDWFLVGFRGEWVIGTTMGDLKGLS